MLLNRFICVGRLGRDPEMSYTPSGTAVTKFSIAVDQGKEKPAMWLNIVTWNQVAERINTQASKGNEVCVQGRLAMRSYTDRNGQQRQSIEVIAASVQLTQYPQQPSSGAGSQPEDGGLGDLDDHPF